MSKTKFYPERPDLYYKTSVLRGVPCKTPWTPYSCLPLACLHVLQHAADSVGQVVIQVCLQRLLSVLLHVDIHVLLLQAAVSPNLTLETPRRQSKTLGSTGMLTDSMAVFT